MEIAVIVLMTSALASTGLLALWAATSRRHWFLRTAAFLAALSPLLFVPAYEPFVALSLEGGLVTAGVAAGRALSRKQRSKLGDASLAENTPSRFRFSMASLLLAIPLCAFAAYIASRLPALNRNAWQSVALAAGSGALATLLGYWAATRKSVARRILAIGVAIIAMLVCALAPVGLDWYVPSLVEQQGWPPTATDMNASIPVIGIEAETAPQWFAILPAVALSIAGASCLVAFLGRGRRGNKNVGPPRAARSAAWLLLVTGPLIVAVPSVAAMYWLLFPDPIPQEALPNPNGFDDLVAAGNMLLNKTINSINYDPSTATSAQVAQAAGEVVTATDLGRRGLQKASFARPAYTNDKDAFDRILPLRSLSRAFNAEGQNAKMNGDFDKSLGRFTDSIHLGVTSRRGGLLIDGLVGVAITGIGCSGIYDVRNDLTAEQCRRAIADLQTAIESREPFEMQAWRDEIYEQHAFGWHGRLVYCLNHVTGADDLRFNYVFQRETAVLRLLIAELCVRAFVADQGRLPQAWREVTAAGLPGLLADPWSVAGEPLRYRRTNDGYLLYSVGLNGVDDAGSTPSQEEVMIGSPTGDFRLAALYAPEPTTQAAEAGADDATSASD